MKPRFKVIFLEQAIDFIESLDAKTRKKVLYNIDKVKIENDPRLFKKLTGEIWEFRTRYKGLQYRFFAFWDKTGEQDTLVISTHGIVKKVDKVPKAEIEKAGQIRTDYFDSI